MEFGVFWLLQQPHLDRPIQDRYADVIEQVQDADELGFHCAWFAEHHFSNYGMIPSPLTFIAHLAARTRRIRLAPGILVLPFYNPLRLAEEAAMVDVLSGGRLICGIGRGYQAMEFRGYDVALEESRERYDECVAILLKAWTEEDWGFEGKHFRVPAGTTVLPRPVQRPHPPIWAGMWGSPESLRTAARNGWVPLVGGYTRSLDDVRAMRRAWDHELLLVGRDPRSLPFTSVRHVTVLEDARDARHFVEDNRWIDRVATALRRDDQVIRGGRISVRPPDDDLDDDEILCLSIIGAPDQVLERIRAEEACGVDYLLCHFDYGALPHDVVRRSMRLFAHEVAPRLASPGSALSRAVR